MRQIKARHVEIMERNARRAFFDSLKLGKTDLTNRFKKERETIMEIIEHLTFSNENLSQDFLTELNLGIHRDLFFSNQEQAENNRLWNKRIKRLFSYFIQNGYVSKFRERQSIHHVIVQNLPNVEIAVPFSYIFFDRDSNEIEIVKVLTTEPTLSSRGRKPETRPENNLGLYMLHKVAHDKYPTASVIRCSYFHLKNKDDSGSVFIEEYNHKVNKNIVSTVFSPRQIEVLEERLRATILDNQNLSLNSACNTSECKDCFYQEICDRLTVRLGNEIVPEILTQEAIEEDRGIGYEPSESQVIAIDDIDGVMRLNAAAGTGKTYTLMSRLSNMLSQGFNTREILLLTFTNNAVEEMKRKIAKLNPTINIDSLEIYTFNGFGMEIIKDNYSLLGYTAKPTIINKIECYDLMFELLDGEELEGFDQRNPLLNFPKAKGAVVKLSQLFDKMKTEDLGIYDLQLEYDVDVAEQIFSLYERYQDMLIQRNLIEYHDQIRFGKMLISTNEEVASKYCYTHIMVDEYQDTDPSQSQMVRVLKYQALNRSLFVVGDEIQAIYGFRYADQRNILNFHEHYPEVKDVFLVENYRSTQEILNTANKLSEKNEFRIPKELVSANNQHGDIPKLYRCANLEQELEALKDRILARKEIVGYRNIAILTRTGYELDIIKNYLDSNNIPSMLETAIKYINHPTVKKVINLIEVLNDKDNTLSLFNYLLEDMDKTSLEILSEANQDLVDKLIKEEIVDFPHVEDDIDGLTQVFDILGAESLDFVGRHFVEMLKSKDFRSVSELVNYTLKMKYYEDDTLSPLEGIEYDAVKLITSHGSKGTEHDTVFVMLDKFTNSIDLSNQEEVEEERRVLFVAITRAKKELNLMYHTNVKNITPFVEDFEDVDKIFLDMPIVE